MHNSECLDVRTLESIVALALLRTGGDTKGPRLLRELVAMRPDLAPAMLLEPLADRLWTDRDEACRRMAVARERAPLVCLAASSAGHGVVTIFDERYPEWLRQIVDPPVVMWTRGARPDLDRRAVAVVGSRHASAHGIATARRLAAGLSEAGLTVVSGLARGIDAAAHRGALAGPGQTIAVLGCGVDVIYPAEHRQLADEVMARGALVSEYPAGTRPHAGHFPLRNRIISGLCRAVVVVEASKHSGSLITARMALEQGRDVLAVPGSVVSGCHAGCHALIKDGARLVETVEDILEELGWSGPASSHPPNHNQLKGLSSVMPSGVPVSLDELAVRTGRAASDLLVELSEREIAGQVARVAGGWFVRLD